MLGSIWTYWMLIDRQRQSEFMPDRSWPSATCRFSTKRSFDHHGKRNSNYIKRVSKKGKKLKLVRISLSDFKVPLLEATLTVNVSSACKRGRRPTERYFREDSHRYPQANICSALYSDHDDASDKTTSRGEAPQASCDRRTGTVFRLDQRKHFKKRKHLYRSNNDLETTLWVTQRCFYSFQTFRRSTPSSVE